MNSYCATRRYHNRRVALEMSDNEISLRPIGVVHTSLSNDEIKESKSTVEGSVEIYREYEEALDGIDGFSHIFVIAYFNRLRADQIGPLKVKPRGLLRLGLKIEDLPLLGVFSLDSPTRPNPIGVSLVPLIRRDGRILHIPNLEYFDGTPVLDIKPYQSSYRVDSYTVPEWHSKLISIAGRV